MNRIPEWNHENPRCFLCGEVDLKVIQMELKDNKHDSAVCEKCRAVYIDLEEGVHFMGFMEEKNWIKLLTMKVPVIQASPKMPVDPQMN